MTKFKVAFVGLIGGFKHQSILTQWLLAIITVIACFIMNISYVEIMLVCICISLVLGFEYLNTSIEKTCDLISTETDERIKFIKDIAAAAVLIQAICALVVMLIILINIFRG